MYAVILIILLSFLPFCSSAQTGNDSIMISVNDTTPPVLPDSLQILSENGSTVNEAEADTLPDETEELEEPELVLHELPTVLDSIYNFRHSLGTLPDSVTSNAYIKYNVNIIKRNMAMFFVPKVDVLISGDRKLVGESLNKVTFYEGDRTKSEVVVINHTFSKSGARNVPALTEYLTPYIYNPTIFKSFVFSPFHKSNHKFYKYKLKELGAWAELSFKPRIKNPQLIKGKALIDPNNGRVLTTTFKCNFRMYKLKFDIEMNDGSEPMNDPQGGKIAPLLPKKCNIEALMRFLWNKIDIHYENTYELPIMLADTIEGYQNRQAMNELRPYPLTEDEEAVFEKYDSLHTPEVLDSIYQAEHKGISMKRLWNDYGKQLFKSHTAEIGNADFKLNPIIDPMQLLYSATKGFIYRIKTRAVVQLGSNSRFSFAPNGAYNFHRKRCYFELPITWEYNIRRNAHIQMNMYNTDPISNTGIKYEKKRVQDKNKIDFDSLSLEYFHNLHLILDYQYAFREWNHINVGFNFYRRSPMHKKAIDKEGKVVKTNFTFAPFVEWTQRLWKNGPTFNINYEQGIMDVMGGTNSYGKQETDITWKIPLRQLRTVSMRLGGGCFIFNNRNRFLDFNKFRDNNLQDHWNDKWTSDFQLIDRRWYNASDFYFRSNVTYESPLLMASWLPVVGRHVRMERVYINNLVVEDFHPYSEIGYGFATKAFSFAAYASFMNGKYNSVGCRFALELYTSHY